MRPPSLSVFWISSMVNILSSCSAHRQATPAAVAAKAAATAMSPLKRSFSCCRAPIEAPTARLLNATAAGDALPRRYEYLATWRHAAAAERDALILELAQMCVAAAIFVGFTVARDWELRDSLASKSGFHNVV